MAVVVHIRTDYFEWKVNSKGRHLANLELSGSQYPSELDSLTFSVLGSYYRYLS